MSTPVLVLLALLIAPDARADDPTPLRFDRVVIDDDFPGGYQVEVADVDGDKKPDIVALGGSTLAWYQNPSWTKRIIAKGQLPADIISAATADLDGDGRAEVAVACDFAMNEPTRGRLVLAVQGKTSDDPWTFRTLADVPSIHRLRWGDLDGNGHPLLVVAPIFGSASRPPDYDDPATLAAYSVGDDPKAGDWRRRFEVRMPVLHAIEVRPAPGFAEGRVVVFAADRYGVHRININRERVRRTIEVDTLIPGAKGPGRRHGSSEVHLGKLADGRPFLATIDPWHGNEVAVCIAEAPNRVETFGPRAVLDATLDDGHALWVADADGDGTDEVFAGHRGKDARVSVYRYDGKAWSRTVLDAGLTAQDLRGGDLDGDGVPDVVAIGGKSHNIVWFRPIRGKAR